MLKVRIPPVWGLDGLKTRTDVISIFPWGWALLRFPPLARREYVGLAAGAVLVLAAVVVVSASDVTVVASEEVAAAVEDSRVVVTDAFVVLEASVVSEAVTVVESSTNVVIDDSTVLVKSDVVATVVGLTVSSHHPLVEYELTCTLGLAWTSKSGVSDEADSQKKDIAMHRGA